MRRKIIVKLAACKVQAGVTSTKIGLTPQNRQINASILFLLPRVEGEH